MTTDYDFDELVRRASAQNNVAGQRFPTSTPDWTPRRVTNDDAYWQRLGRAGGRLIDSEEPLWARALAPFNAAWQGVAEPIFDAGSAIVGNPGQVFNPGYWRPAEGPGVDPGFIATQATRLLPPFGALENFAPQWNDGNPIFRESEFERHIADREAQYDALNPNNPLGPLGRRRLVGESQGIGYNLISEALNPAELPFYLAKPLTSAGGVLRTAGRGISAGGAVRRAAGQTPTGVAQQAAGLGVQGFGHGVTGLGRAAWLTDEAVAWPIRRTYRGLQRVTPSWLNDDTVLRRRGARGHGIDANEVGGPVPALDADVPWAGAERAMWGGEIPILSSGARSRIPDLEVPGGVPSESGLEYPFGYQPTSSPSFEEYRRSLVTPFGAPPRRSTPLGKEFPSDPRMIDLSDPTPFPPPPESPPWLGRGHRASENIDITADEPLAPFGGEHPPDYRPTRQESELDALLAQRASISQAIDGATGSGLAPIDPSMAALQLDEIDGRINALSRQATRDIPATTPSRLPSRARVQQETTIPEARPITDRVKAAAGENKYAITSLVAGGRLKLRAMVVDLDDPGLLSSHSSRPENQGNLGGLPEPTPGYPQIFQERVRETERNFAAIQSRFADTEGAINDYQPVRVLADTKGIDDGPPIVWNLEDEDVYAVLSGNGRVLGMRNAPRTYQKYRSELDEMAGGEWGIEPSSYAHMSKPYLVRVIDEPLDNDALVKLASEANAPTTAPLTRAEMARRNGRGLDDTELGKVFDNVGAPIDIGTSIRQVLRTKGSQQLLTRYYDDVAPEIKGKYTKGRDPNTQDVIFDDKIYDDLEDALLGRVFKVVDVEDLSGNAQRYDILEGLLDPVTKHQKIRSALNAATPMLLRGQLQIENGAVPPNMNLAPVISEAYLHLTLILDDNALTPGREAAQQRGQTVARLEMRQGQGQFVTEEAQSRDIILMAMARTLDGNDRPLSNIIDAYYGRVAQGNRSVIPGMEAEFAATDVRSAELMAAARNAAVKWDAGDLDFNRKQLCVPH